MNDYYAILGLDRGASPESIKVAYRRLARENHPDRKIDSTEAERNLHSAHMALLNEAYSILSDSKRRREYDDKVKTMEVLQSSTVTRSTVTKTVSKSSSSTGQRGRSRNGNDPTVAREIARQLRTQLLAKREGFSWEEIRLEGFDWGLEAVSWTSHYCVGARGFAVLDPAAAKKFTNYSEFVLAHCSRSIRKSHFLFLLAFQQLAEWDSVSAQLHRFVSGETRAKSGDTQIVILALDTQRGRTLRFGTQLAEKRFEQILHCVGMPL